MSAVTAHAARADDVDRLCHLLAGAFDDDPVLRWLYPERDRRALAAPKLFRGERTYGIRHGERPLTDENADLGAALWCPPRRWRSGLLYAAACSPAFVHIRVRRLPKLLAGLSQVESAHPSAPHWYLRTLATTPHARGQGVGTALMRPVLDDCDRDTLGAYLESSKERNIVFYERLGFEVTRALDLLDGPTIYCMYRDPS